MFTAAPHAHATPGVCLLKIGDKIASWTIDDLVYPGVPTLYAVSRGDEVGTLKATPIHDNAQIAHRREVDAVRGIEHPNIQKLLDAGISYEAKVVFAVYPPFNGYTLADRLIEGPIPWQDAAHLFLGVSAALERLHQREVVHRRISPETIVVNDDGTAFLTGFEHAMDLEEIQSSPEAIREDVVYLAHEVITDTRSETQAADVFALGATLFEALAGRAYRTAFVVAGNSDVYEETQRGATSNEQMAVRLPEDVPPWLLQLLRSSTELNVRHRLQEAEAVSRRLAAGVDPIEVLEPEESPLAVSMPALALQPSVAGWSADPDVAPLAASGPGNDDAGSRMPIVLFVAGGVFLAVVLAIVLTVTLAS